MPIRVYDDEPRHDRPSGGGATGTTGAPRRGRPLLTMALAVVIALAMVGAALLWARGRSKTPAAEGPAASATAAPAPVGTPAPTPAGGLPINATTFQVAPELYVGSATVRTGHTSTLHGVPVGWAQTENGAIGAAMQYDAAYLSPAMLIDASRKELIDRLYTADGRENGPLTDDVVKAIREKFHLTPTNQVLEPNGTPSTTKRYIAKGMPEYGAYRVESLSSGHPPTEVRVRVWMPGVAGVVNGTSDYSNAKLYWTDSILTMRWSGGEWKIAGYDSKRSNDVPKPADQSFSNQTYQARRDILGAGWCVAPDSTEKPFDGAVMTR